MGKQPASGLTFSSLYSFIISCCIRGLSSFHRSCTAFIFGCTTRICAIEANCFCAMGNMNRRTMIVRPIIATPKLPNTPNSQWSIQKNGMAMNQNQPQSIE